MRVADRLFLAVVPAVVGVLLVAALAYWGEYGRSAPEWLIGIAAVAAVVSLVLTWRNTRYVARRLDQLTRALPREPLAARSALDAVREVARPRHGADELDAIAGELARLSSEAATAHADVARSERQASDRIQEYAALLAECATTVDRQLEEVRLPLHILLENHFGQLNDNQEEMIGAARQAADQAGVELERLVAIADLDRGALTLRRELVQVADIVRGIRPAVDADAERRGLVVAWDIAPGLPRIPADRDRLLQALDLLLRHVVALTAPGQRIGVSLDRAERGISITIEHEAVSMMGPDVALARRVVAAQGGAVTGSPRGTVVTLGGAG